MAQKKGWKSLFICVYWKRKNKINFKWKSFRKFNPKQRQDERVYLCWWFAGIKQKLILFLYIFSIIFIYQGGLNVYGGSIVYLEVNNLCNLRISRNYLETLVSKGIFVDI